MRFDMGLQGLIILVAISLLFGLGAQLLLAMRHTRWMWLVGAAAWFVGGLFSSEVVFGTMTAQELQPIIDGLALDESLLGGLVLGVPVVILTWYATRHHHLHGPMAT